MDASFCILFWWLLFGATHIGFSAGGLRRSLVARLGPRGFQALYSVIALATFVPLVRAYFGHRHVGPLLWDLHAVPGVRHLAMLLAVCGMSLLVASFFQPSPVGAAPAKVEAHGLLRITRHPLFCAFVFWGIAHAIVNGSLGDVLFFGGFVVFSLAGAVHQDARKQRDEGERLGAFYVETSVVPFAAILGGRGRLALGELPWVGLGIGLVVGVAVYLLHPRLFGG